MRDQRGALSLHMRLGRKCSSLRYHIKVRRFGELKWFVLRVRFEELGWTRIMYEYTVHSLFEEYHLT